MGASIYWTPKAGGTLLDVGLRSRFVEAMNEAFGPYPWKLGHTQVPTLLGLRAAWGEQDRRAFDRLIDAINEHIEIEVWPEY